MTSPPEINGDEVEPGKRVASVESSASATEKRAWYRLAFAATPSLVAALFFWGVSLSDVEYFTTWALFIHGTYFAFVAIDVVFFGRPRISGRAWVYRWAFVPCLTIAIAVAVSVTYLMYALWEDEADEDHCADTIACRDLFVEFIVAHYFPPVAYLGAYVIDDVRIGNSRRSRRTRDGRRPPDDVAFEADDATKSKTKSFVERFHDERARYSIAVFQASLVPTLVYSSFMNPDVVYGSGTNAWGVVVYVATVLVCSVVVAYPLSENAP